MAEGIGQTSPWEKLQGQVLPGGPGFVERVKPGLRARRPIKEISRTQRFVARPALVKLFRSGALADLFRRNEVIRRAYLEHGYSLSEIGRAVGLHYSTISRIVNQDTGKPNGRHEI